MHNQYFPGFILKTSGIRPAFSLGRRSVFLLIALTVCASTSFAQKNISPDEMALKMIHNPAFVDNPSGEDFCWNACVNMDVFMDNYRLTNNREWLSAGITYYDFLIGNMKADPDGYKGWIGPSGYQPNYWQDALVGDAILLSGIMDFSIEVLEDEQLKKLYGKKAEQYVQIAERDFVKKWDGRGAWYEDGPYGSYMEYNKFLKPGDLTTWIKDEKYERAGISHPFNKQMDAGILCLKLFRVTGNKFYRDRAERIFLTAKSHFQYFDDHYTWNYFEPLTPGDVDLERKTTKHGVWVHPWRSGYQAGEVQSIAEAYHYGIVFDEQDIKRIINTNLNVMWNKDAIHPEFISSNGLGAERDTSGKAAFKAAYGHSINFKNEGELWTGLLDFSQTVRDLYELRFKNDHTSRGYLMYKKNIQQNPPSFKRKYVKDVVTVPAVRFTASRDLSLATVLPHTITKKNKSIIISQSNASGNLRIDLYDTSGKLLLNIYKGHTEEDFFITTWDGKDPAGREIYKGDYYIRWTTGGGYREFPVVIE